MARYERDNLPEPVSDNRVLDTHGRKALDFKRNLQKVSIPYQVHGGTGNKTIFDFSMGLKNERWVASDVKISEMGRILDFSIRPPRFRAVRGAGRAERMLEKMLVDIKAPDPAIATAHKDTQGNIDTHIEYDRGVGDISNEEFFELVDDIREYWETRT